MSAVKIDESAFCARVKLLVDSLRDRQSTLWEHATAVSIAVGSASEDIRYLKSIALQLWLFGYELPDTIMVFTAADLHIITSSKKEALLKDAARKCKEVNDYEVKFYARGKGDDGQAQIQQLLQVITQSGVDPKLGTLPREKHEGALIDAWTAATGSVTQVDVSAAISDVLAAKDKDEQVKTKKGGYLAGQVMSKLIKRIEDTLDNEAKVKHSKLASEAEEWISNPQQVGVKLKADNTDIAYPPMIQSGGVFDLKIGTESTDEKLHRTGTFVCSIGTKYQSYCATLARTIFVDPSKQQEQEYVAIRDAQQAAIAALKPGAKLKAAYEAVVDTLKAKGQGALVSKLAKNVGFATGLELRDSKLQLTSNNEATVRPGMIFIVGVTVTDLHDPSITDAKAARYAIHIADTVLVNHGTAAVENLTEQFCASDFGSIANTLNEDDASKDGDDDLDGLDMDKENGMHEGRKHRLRGDDPNHHSAERLRREKQEELLQKKNMETYRRLTEQKDKLQNQQASSSGRSVVDIVSYKNISEIPPSRDLLVQIDRSHDTILLPIYGVMVPFHIATIKSISCNQDGDHALIRVNFNFSGSYEPAVKFPNAIFIKELTFRSTDAKRATKCVQEISTMRRQVLQRDKELAERATIIKQEKLVRGKRVYRLPELWVRPSFGGKGRRMTGVLEAHSNGFRYTTPKGEAVDVMFRNIKHAFFQPAEKEMITLLHFHLMNPIMVGKKKTKDVQFYAEVMEVVQTLDGGRRGYDPDELEEEQREREKKNRINAEFQQFTRKLQEMWDREFADLNLEFEIPYRDLGFQGVPHRTTCYMMPTVNCLVELIEMPFTVVPIHDIELVNFERVGYSLKNFDMAIIFKDYSKDVVRVDAIPSQSLDTLKEWLTSVNIKYYESKFNLNWRQVLKTIVEDPDGFMENGGWDFLNADKSDDEEGEGGEGGDGEEVSDEEFHVASDEDDDDDDDEVSDDSLLSEGGDDSDGGAGEDEEEESGMDWDDLEEEARQADRDRGDFSDEEEDASNRQKRKGGGAAPMAKRRK